jgi:hypothetical protein
MADLKLAKTEITPMLQQRVLRMLADIYALTKLTAPEIRAVYSPLEEARDALSRMLDNADGKDV